MATRFDPDIINKAPISPVAASEATEEITELRHQNTILEDENAKLKAEISVESQKARLLIPYANKVFWFCVVYSIVAFSILFLDGCETIKFDLETSTLNFIAGTNLASVIGLLAIIAGGIFKSK